MSRMARGALAVIFLLSLMSISGEGALEVKLTFYPRYTTLLPFQRDEQEDS